MEAVQDCEALRASQSVTLIRPLTGVVPGLYRQVIERELSTQCPSVEIGHVRDLHAALKAKKKKPERATPNQPETNDESQSEPALPRT